MKKVILILLVSVLALSAFPAMGASTEAPAEAGYTSLYELNGKEIGCETGMTYDVATRHMLPKAKIVYFNSLPDTVSALLAGKIDGFPCDEPILRAIMRENDQLVALPEKMDEFSCGFIFAKNAHGDQLRGQMNTLLAEMRANGELDALIGKWSEVDPNAADMPDPASLPADNGTLTLATSGMTPPFTYILNAKVVGMEIELAYRFCLRWGYGLEISTMSFNGILPAVQKGRCDFGADLITITDERAESVNFSEPHYHCSTLMVVLKQKVVRGVYTSLAELNGHQVGVQTGTNFDEAVSKTLPESQIRYFNTKADMVAALTGGKIAGFTADEPVARMLMRQSDQLVCLPEYLQTYEFGAVFAKDERGRSLQEQFNGFLAGMKADGSLEALQLKWLGDDEEAKTMPDASSLSAVNGVLKVATEAGYEPFEYVRDNQFVGFDMELITFFCQANGYGLEIVNMDFGGVLAAVMTGRCDLAMAGISVTPERAESVLFSDAYFDGRTVMIVLREKQAAPGFWGGIADSFQKTFLREERWRLFGRGILTTLLITVLSILCGTALGFLLFMLCRGGRPVPNAVTRFCVWLVQGTPMVVLLMILYYLIFSSADGVAVAVIGFTLTFGAAVLGMLRTGEGAIDRGQYEAAGALGYSDRRTFFRIILPQIIPHAVSSYKSEIVGLIKATAVVGYIAVEDLTKMGDIVRSRTYEAFFPLIAITVIYFVLEFLIAGAVSRIHVRFDPRRRSRERILKGVKTDD